MSKWKHRLRVTVFDESSYSEIRVFRGSPRGWATWVGLAGLALVTLTYLVVAQTPVREWVVPGYVAESTRADIREARAATDSMSRVLAQQELSLWALRHALVGDSAALGFLQRASEGGAGFDSLEIAAMDSAALFPGPGEEALRHTVEQADRFALQRRNLGRATLTGFSYPPLVGGVSDELDLGVGHLGVDLVAPEGTAIQSVDDGSVLFSSYTIETGYTLVIQHRGDRVSIYKHCASLLKRQGDLVAGGEAIALMGNTGELSSGPHLHFEWWVKGQPVDPSPWLGRVVSEEGD
ncbi:MAG: M23 family metallopeptidase [Flavobacteriales bacterium]